MTVAPASRARHQSMFDGVSGSSALEFVGRHRFAFRTVTSLFLLGTMVMLVLAVKDGARLGSMMVAILNVISWTCITGLFGFALPRQADRQAAAQSETQ